MCLELLRESRGPKRNLQTCVAAEHQSELAFWRAFHYTLNPPSLPSESFLDSISAKIQRKFKWKIPWYNCITDKRKATLKKNIQRNTSSLSFSAETWNWWWETSGFCLSAGHTELIGLHIWELFRCDLACLVPFIVDNTEGWVLQPRLRSPH